MTTLTDTVIEDDRWQAADLASLSERAARATLAHLGLDPEDFEICVMGCDDPRIAELNAEFRDKPRPTNVLSWPAEDLAPEEEGTLPEPPDDGPMGGELGDIAISYDTCLREAEESALPFADHVTHLVVHGILHLLGYDHIRDGDAALMEGTEIEILGNLGIPDPYNRETGTDAG
ncbi:rRNA maturation RNase YbeY [Pseudooceanicola sp. CBS1P-1]|uniref:Endoribonuclease YbeY n=1 Tax=Pseudooceanicola albus TaxID=2692189 RepID=A0A6L7G2Q8_9RHOB|nr:MULTISPECIES: rRNA maturation RNase YbeY [Pseudooceanicola]MBT9384610.1 rRNA maturation RNase YbeY [Pseudooceanicola endophyticus]MXN18311.1 rRNA maturation RNase YbeY [Pseudooceanicola albus]